MKITMGGCRAKLRRAEEHTKTLKEQIDRWFDEFKGLGISPQFYPKTGDNFVKITAVQKIPAIRWGIIIGDAINNYRAALDHFVWQLAIRNSYLGGPGPGVRTQFPICTSYDAWRKADGLDATEWNVWAVLQHYQPYKGADLAKEPFWYLGELSRTDKHQIINPVLFLPHEFKLWPISIHDGLLEEFRLLTIQGPLKKGAKIAYLRLSPPDAEATVKVNGYVIPKVAFPNGFPVLNVLYGIRNNVRHIFREFQGYFRPEHLRQAIEHFEEGTGAYAHGPKPAVKELRKKLPPTDPDLP